MLHAASSVERRERSNPSSNLQEQRHEQRHLGECREASRMLPRVRARRVLAVACAESYLVMRVIMVHVRDAARRPDSSERGLRLERRGEAGRRP